MSLQDCSLQLLRMNYSAASFKLPEWIHSYHRIWYPTNRSILRLQLRGNTSTLLFAHCSTFTRPVSFSNALIFYWFFMRIWISISCQPRLPLQLNSVVFTAYSNCALLGRSSKKWRKSTQKEVPYISGNGTF